MGSICGVILVNWGIATGRVAMHKDGTIVPVNHDAMAGSVEAAEKGGLEYKDGSEEAQSSEGVTEGSQDSLCKKMFGDRDVPPDIYKVDDVTDERPPGGRLTVRQDAVESLALHLIYVAFACFF